MINFNLPRSVYHGEQHLSYAADSLITFHHFAGKDDASFKFALEEARKKCNHSLYHEWRLYLAVQLQLSLLQSSIVSDSNYLYVECGVGEAHTLLVTFFYLQSLGGSLFEKFTQSTKILFDTFTGVDKTLIEKDDDRRYKTKSYHNSSFESVKENLNMIQNIIFKPGSIPETLIHIPLDFRSPNFLHIDMNHHVPEIEALNFFYFSMRPGSIILLDDYSFTMSYRQRNAVNSWCQQNCIQMPINLPTGQGILIR